MLTALWIIYGAASSLRMAFIPELPPDSYEAFAWIIIATVLGAYTLIEEKKRTQKEKKTEETMQ